MTEPRTPSTPDRAVLVTGAASGLGRAVAAAVADVGWEPLGLDRVPCDGLDHEIVDLADGRAAEAAVRRLTERHPTLAGLVAAAGTDACGRIEDVPAEQWDRVVAVNLLGTAAVVRAALPAVEAGEGRIVTVASTLGLRALPDATAYCASKFGVVGFTRALGAELAGRVGVTLLVPGGMDTAFFDGRTEQYRPPADLKLNDPASVADAVLFALRQPVGCEVRELVVTPAIEGSYP